MVALHRYLIAWHNVNDYDKYLQLLVLFRNTAAIEATKAQARHDKIRKSMLHLLSIQSAIVEEFWLSRNQS